MGARAAGLVRHPLTLTLPLPLPLPLTLTLPLPLTLTLARTRTRTPTRYGTDVDGRIVPHEADLPLLRDESESEGDEQ